MSKFSRLLIMFLLLTILQSSMTKNSNRISWEEDTSDDESGERAVHERPLDDFSQLRHFLLTANAEQRAARREEQEFHKRELIREYLQSVSDPNPERYQEIRKRFKTFCHSYEDVMNSNWATCG